MTQVSPKARRKARVFALQALYQWVYTQEDIHEVASQFLITNQHHSSTDWTYFSELLRGVATELAALDVIITAAADRSLAEISPIELVILRLAVFEMKHLKLHPNIVMNEYIDLAHEYGTEEGYRYINGVLDKLAQTVS